MVDMRYNTTNGGYKLSEAQVAPLQVTGVGNNTFGAVEFLKIATVVIEVGSIVGISLFSGGSLSALAVAAIGVLGASARLAIDAWQGSISALSTTIDYAAALLPVASQAYKGISYQKKLVASAKTGFLKTKANNIGKGAVRKLNNDFVKGLDNIAHSFEETRKLEQIIKLAEKKLGLAARNDPSYIAQVNRIATRKLGKPLKSVPRNFNMVSRSATSRQLRTKVQFVAKRSRSVVRSNKNIKAQVKLMRDYARLEGAILDGSFRQSTGIWFRKEQLEQAMHKLAPSVRKSIFEHMFSGKKVATAAEKAARGAKGQMNEIYEALAANSKISAKRAEALKLLTQSAGVSPPKKYLLWESRTRAKWLTEWNEQFKSLASTFNKKETRIINNILGVANPGEPAGPLLNTLLVSEAQKGAWSTARVLRYLGSKQFNYGFVQKAQLINPNNAGRYGPEIIYRASKKLIDKKLDRIGQQSVNKTVKKIAKEVLKHQDNISKAFEQSGGVLIPPNRYLIGYKLMPTGRGGDKRLVLLKFNRAHTESAQGKNMGGKRDVLVTMTKEQLRALKKEGVDYYWTEGEHNLWYTSRGGKRTSKTKIVLTERVSLFLSFIPIPALRNVFSITSNWVSQIEQISTGQYAETYMTRLKASLTRASMNRSSRLVSRVIAGGFIKGYARKKANSGFAQFLGKHAPRELQRLASNTVTQFQSVDSKGNFKFKAINAATWGRGVALGAATSLRSAGFRQTRKKSTNGFMGQRESIKLYAAEMQSARTKFRTVRRLGSATLPRSLYNPRSFTRFKL